MLVFVTLSVWLINGALGWNGEGHRIVARVAASLVSGKTRRFIRDHLDPKAGSSMRKFESALVRSSTWADTVVTDLPWSADFHFTHTPYRDCTNFVQSRDCGRGSGRCLVTAIANYTRRACDITLDISERTEALQFLIHFIADAHQPLHTGFFPDRGGTLIGISSPVEDSLHEVWDSFLIEKFKESNGFDHDHSWFGSAESLIRSLTVSDALKNSYSLPVDIGDFESASAIVSDTVTSHTCNSAYQSDVDHWIIDGEGLSVEYIADRTEVVKTQLQKASVRLAQYLNIIAERYYAAERAIEERTVVTRDPSISNRFDALDLEFEIDVEEAVYEVPVTDEEWEGTLLSEDEETPTASVVVVAAATATTSSPEDKKKALNRKNKQRRLVNKRKLFGIDIASLVLIKRGRQFFVTYRQLVSSDSYRPGRFSIVDVRFAGSLAGTSQRFFFDLAVFPCDRRSEPELIIAVFKKLGGLDYSSTASSSSEVSEYAFVGQTDSELRVSYSGALSKMAAPLRELEAAGVIAPTDYSTASYASIASFVYQHPPKAILRVQYGGTLPSDEQRAFDICHSQADDIVSFIVESVHIVSR